MSEIQSAPVPEKTPATEDVVPKYAGGNETDSQILHRQPFSVLVGNRVFQYTHIPIKYVDEILYAFMSEQERNNTEMLSKVAELQRQGKLAPGFTVGPETLSELTANNVFKMMDFKHITGILVANIRRMVAEDLNVPLEWVEKHFIPSEYVKLISFVKNDPDVINAANELLKNVLAPASLETPKT